MIPRLRILLMTICFAGCLAPTTQSQSADESRLRHALLLSDMSRYEEALSTLTTPTPSIHPDATKLDRWLRALIGPPPAALSPSPTLSPSHSLSRFRFRMQSELPLLDSLRDLHHLPPTQGLFSKGIPELLSAAGGSRAPIFVTFHRPDLQLDTYVWERNRLTPGFARLTSAAIHEISRTVTWQLTFEPFSSTWFPFYLPIQGPPPPGWPPHPIVPVRRHGHYALPVDHPVINLTFLWPPVLHGESMDILPVPIPWDPADDYMLTLVSTRPEPAHHPRGTFHVEPWKEPWFGNLTGTSLSRFSCRNVMVQILGVASESDRARNIHQAVDILLPSLAKQTRRLPPSLRLMLMPPGPEGLHGFHQDGVIGLPRLEELDPREALAHELIHWAIARTPATWRASSFEEGVAEACARRLLADAGLPELARSRRDRLEAAARLLDPSKWLPPARLAARAVLPEPFDHAPERGLLDYVVLPRVLEPHVEHLLDIVQSTPSRHLSYDQLIDRLQAR